VANNLDIAIRIKAINEASGALRQVVNQIKGIREQTTLLREAAGTLAIGGAAMIGAGVGVGYGLKAMIEPAVAVQEQLHRLQNTLTPGAQGMKDLASAQQATAEWSQKLGVDQEGLIRQLYLGTSAGLDMSTAIKSMAMASQLAVGGQGDLEATQRTLNLAFINFKDPTRSAVQNLQQLSDIMATANAHFDYNGIEELRSQIELATPTAKAAGMGFKDMVAILADWTRAGLTGGMAGEALEESLRGVTKMQEKLGVPMARNAQGGIDLARSLTNVRQHFIDLYGSMSAMPPQVLQQIQEVFGERGLRAILLQKTDFDKMRADLDNVNGATANAAATMMSTPRAQFKQLYETIRAGMVKIGTEMLPQMLALTNAIKPAIKAALAFAGAHPKWVEMATVAAMTATAVLLLGGALAIATSAMMGFASFGTMLSTICESLQLGAALTKAWTAAQWLLDAAMDANPIGLAVVGIVALGVAIGYLIKHWQLVVSFFQGSMTFFKEIGSYIFHALIDPFLELPGAIKAAWTGIKTEVTKVAHNIGRFFVGHSPIPEGPLHDLNLGREIGRSLKPAPVLNAVRAAAAAVALSVPMMAPSVSAGNAYAGSDSGTIVIHFNPTINIGGAPAEPNLPLQIREELRKSADYLVKEIDKVRTRRARLDF
jgi:TP901 family phage tail tape measure protein